MKSNARCRQPKICFRILNGAPMAQSDGALVQRCIAVEPQHFAMPTEMKIQHARMISDEMHLWDLVLLGILAYKSLAILIPHALNSSLMST